MLLVIPKLTLSIKATEGLTIARKNTIIDIGVIFSDNAKFQDQNRKSGCKWKRKYRMDVKSI